jgi:hypothetical protein
LGSSHSIFIDSRDVEVAYLHYSLIHKNVGVLYIPVDYAHRVQVVQALEGLNRHLPNELLLKVVVPFGPGLDLASQVPIHSELGHHAQAVCRLLVKCFLVANDIVVAQTCQQPNFV